MIAKKRTLKVPAAKVWQALTDKDQMKQWYFDIPDFILQQGAVFNFYEPGDAREFHHRCQIKEIITEKKISYTWTHPSHSKGESMVTWMLKEENGSTEVTLQHEGTENFADAGQAFAPENYQIGWEGIMFRLKNYINGLRRHTYQVEIKAPAKKVWNVLWGKETYPRWTSVFSEGSYMKGNLEQGSRIHFLTPDGNGMYADVIFLTPKSYVLFQHVGEVRNFVELPKDDETEKWSGAFESYTLNEEDGKTILTAEVDLTPEDANFFNEHFPKSLLIIKDLAE